jgi:hypothetical protein
MNFKRNRKFFPILVLAFFVPSICLAMPPGTLLYRTTDKGKMFGYSGDPLIESVSGIMTGINPGHTALYIGQENGLDYVVEAEAGGVIKTRLEYFVNEGSGEKFLGAKLPTDLDPIRQAKAVLLAKNLANAGLDYDFDFKKQKGPGSGEWTCVGLTEKIYESADSANPNNLNSLEYNPANYAIDITPDGFDDYSFVSKEGDCFSKTKEFSRIAPRPEMLIPAAEKNGFNAGLIYQGERYMFLPYTQFLQPTLKVVTVDKKISSNFDSAEIRGQVNIPLVLLRWSLINNPLSGVKIAVAEIKDKAVAIFNGVKNVVAGLSNKIFKNSDTDLGIVLEAAISGTSSKNISAGNDLTTAASSKKTSASKIGSVNISVNKNGVPAVSDSKTVLDKVSEKLNTIIQSSTSQAVKNQSSKATAVNLEATITEKESVVIAAATEKSSAAIIGNNANSATLQTVVINKIYSTGLDDFIELYNPNGVEIDLALSGYRLEKTKTAVDPSLILRIGNATDASYPGGTIIPAYGYYLIVRDDASQYYLSRADAIVSRSEFDLNGLNQTVYLGIGAISSYNDEDIADAVGYGPGAVYYRGSAPAKKIEDYYFLNRISRKDNNSLDFNLLLSADPAAVAARKAENELNSDTNSTINNATTTTSTTTATSSSNISSSTDATTIATSTTAVASSSPEETETTLTDAELIAASKQILINRISASGNNDFVELFNFSDYDLDLAVLKFRLEKSKTSVDPAIMMRFGDADDGTYPKGTIIKSHSSYLIVRSDTSSYYLNQADAIATRDEFHLFNSGYSIYLGSDAISSDSDPDIIDLVGYGPGAVFYSGLSPAPKIDDGFVLSRTSDSKQNHLDFTLVPDDNLNIAAPSGDDEPTADGIFVPLTPQKSVGIQQIWHFDDCYGNFGGRATLGKWNCGRELGYLAGNFSGSLDPVIDANAFSVSYYYHPAIGWPRTDIILRNENGNDFAIGIEPGYIDIYGISNSGQFYLGTDFSNEWHLLTFVVNQAEDYWALYSDGRELLRRSFLARLPIINAVEVSGGGGTMAVDELTVWNRALGPGEVTEIYQKDRPFYPVEERDEQEPAKLLYNWRFEEDTGSKTLDSVNGQVLNVNSSLWLGRAHDNYALTVSHPYPVETTLSKPIIAPDLSMAFWWKNASYPDAGRAQIMLTGPDNSGQERNQFALLADYYSQGFFFNGKDEVISGGLNKAIPYDGAWHHLALVYDSYRYQMKLYVDGEEKASRGVIRFRDGDEKITGLKILADSQNSAIDELQIFSGALTAVEVKGLYDSTKAE